MGNSVTERKKREFLRCGYGVRVGKSEKDAMALLLLWDPVTLPVPVSGDVLLQELKFICSFV